MKSTILGRIIAENVASHAMSQQILALEKKLNETPNPVELQTIQEQINSLKNLLQQNNGDKLRGDLIRQIENFTGRKLITYFSINGSISDRDACIIDDFLTSNKIREVDILVDSPGGFTDASEKMIMMCRIRAGSYRVIVVKQAKSAATLFALGSNKILLCESAELGPVDPQIMVFAPNGEKVRDSAHQIYYGSQKHLEKSNRWWRRSNDGNLLLLSKYDPVAIKRAEVAINHTKDIIKKRIYTNPDLNKEYDKDGIEEDLKIFVEHEALFSHGRPIYYDDIKNLNCCKNKFIQKFCDYYKNDENKNSSDITAVEDKLWELTMRSLEVVRPDVKPIKDHEGKIIGFNKVAFKLFESSNGLILTEDILN